jgi:hypothetical protein
MLYNMLYDMLNMLWVGSPESMIGFVLLEGVSLCVAYHTWKIRMLSLLR